LKEQQAQEHQPLAEDAVHAAKVRKDARPNGEDHGGGKPNTKSVARGAPDASVLIGEGSPNTH
jgi:hypothetical protein